MRIACFRNESFDFIRGVHLQSLPQCAESHYVRLTTHLSDCVQEAQEQAASQPKWCLDIEFIGNTSRQKLRHGNALHEQ